ncbi:hypothetical protein ACX9I7_06775 [Streptomyces sp. L500]
MDTATAVTTIISLVIAKVCAVAALWIRLRRRDVEVEERHGDGRCLRVRITHAPVPGEGEGA